jgi:hypothetical protein
MAKKSFEDRTFVNAIGRSRCEDGELQVALRELIDVHSWMLPVLPLHRFDRPA